MSRPLDLYTLLQVKDALQRAAQGMSDAFLRGYIEAWVDGEILKARRHIESVVEREA